MWSANLLLLLYCAPAVHSKRVSQDGGIHALEGDSRSLATGVIYMDSDSNVSSCLVRRHKAVGTSKWPGGPLPIEAFCPGSTNNKKSGFDDFYAKTKILGKGAFGTVYAAAWHPMTKSIDNKAVKEVLWVECKAEPKECHKKTSFDPEELRPMTLNLPFVVHLDSVFVGPMARKQDGKQTTVSLVTERYMGGDLLELTNRYFQARKKLTLDAIKHVSAQIAYGLWQLHRSGIIHKDIKPDNIFLVSNDSDSYKEWKVVLADFGISMQCGPIACTDQFSGTPAYMSPSVTFQEKYGYEVDWWAFAITLTDMAGCGGLFKGDSAVDILKNVLHARDRMPSVHSCIQSSSMAPLRAFVESIFDKYRFQERTNEGRKAMESSDAADHPILSNPFFHGMQKKEDIRAFWQNLCHQAAVNKEYCDSPSPYHAGMGRSHHTFMCSEQLPGTTCTDIKYYDTEWKQCTSQAKDNEKTKLQSFKHARVWYEKRSNHGIQRWLKAPGDKLCVSECNPLSNDKYREVCKLAKNKFNAESAEARVKICETNFNNGRMFNSKRRACCSCLATEECASTNCAHSRCSGLGAL